jgi:uncharacterized protein YecT (DUF1311 family)
MHWDTLTMLGLVAAAAAAPMAVQAEGPTFDCGAAKADVETLICSDAALAALDRKLDAVYKAALAKAHAGPLVRQLRQEQRGWTKGRDDCWKANGQDTWITATWTVNTVRNCVDAQYRLRTSELQAVWRLLPPRTLSFACQGEPAKEVVANLFDTDPPTLRLERGDQTKTLWRVGVAGKGRYEGQNISLVYQLDTLKLEWLDTDTGKTDKWQCTTR